MEWVNIETLPPEDTMVLVTSKIQFVELKNPCYDVHYVYHDHRGRFIAEGGGWFRLDVIAWMKVEPFKEESK